MKTMLRKTLMASAVAALVSVPAWAAGDKAGDGMAQDTPRTQPMGQWKSNTTAAATADNQLYSMTPQQLEGKQVYGTTGEQIGEVASIVRGQDQSIHAVISSGGVMGVGEKKVTVSLDELQMQDDKLQLSTTQEQLEARTPYAADQYTALEPADQPISDFAAFEPSQEGAQKDQMKSDDQMKNPTLPGTGAGGRTAPLQPGPGDSIYDKKQ